MIKVLYIGNDLAQRSKYNSAMETLSSLLSSDNYKVYKASNKINKVHRLFEMCYAVFKYRKRVDFILIDTFSTANFYYAFFVSQLAKVFNKKYIPILHGGNLPYRIKRSKRMSDLIFNDSYYNVAPSNYLKTEFEKHGYKVTYIPNVLNINDYRFKLRKKIDPKLFWVRSFKNIYNPTLAIEVLNLLKKDYPDAKLCMVGPEIDSSYNEVCDLVAKYNLKDDVEFTGVLDKKIWHKESEEYDIFINTTNFDNTPVSVLEAMALGMPIVSTNVGGLPFLIDNNVDGILVENKNATIMAQAVNKLLDDYSFAEELTLRARKKVEKFDWSTVKMKWNTILKANV